MSTWSDTVYVAFVIDVFSRRVMSRKADTSIRAALVLDALEMALWARGHPGHPIAAGLIHRSDADSPLDSPAGMVEQPVTVWDFSLPQSHFQHIEG